MSDSDSNLPDSLPNRPDDTSPLQNIIDDTEERGEAREWIHRQFVEGTDADTILAELIATGWPVDDAEGIVEEGRRATRHLRGVVTRDNVARLAEKRYRKAFKLVLRVTLALMILLAIMYGCSSMAFLRQNHETPNAGS